MRPQIFKIAGLQRRCLLLLSVSTESIQNENRSREAVTGGVEGPKHY